MKKSILSFSLFFLLINSMLPQATNKISFSAVPYNKSPKEQTEFKWDQPVYAKIRMEKPLKNYAQKINGYELERYNISGVYSQFLKFICVPEGEDANQRTSNEITLYLTDEELNKNEINVDVMPAAKDATSFFGTGFYAELANKNLVKYNVETETSVGKKTGFTFYLYEREKNGSDGENGIANNKLITNFGVFINLGNIVMDYTPVTDSREFNYWNSTCSAITDSINSKYKK